ncbi:hypothetical protein [Streptomyces bauhiniae]
MTNDDLQKFGDSPSPETEEVLADILRTYGRYHIFDSSKYNPIIIGTLEDEGYVDQDQVTQEAVNDYSSYLTNGPFGSLGGAYTEDRNIRMSIEESLLNIPVYQWNPNPGPEEAHHIPHLRASVRLLEPALEQKWLQWVDEYTQKLATDHPDLLTYESHMKNLPITERLGEKGKKEIQTYIGKVERIALWPHKQGGHRFNAMRHLNDDPWREIAAYAGYGEMPQRARLLSASAMHFASVLRCEGDYQQARQAVHDRRPVGDLPWDETMALEAANPDTEKKDWARWAFHHLHSMASNVRPLHYHVNNPFKMSDFIFSRKEAAPDIFLLHLDSQVARVCQRAYESRQRNGTFPELTGKDQVIVENMLQVAFQALPAEEREVVVKWHRDNQNDPNLWRGNWAPGSKVSLPPDQSIVTTSEIEYRAGEVRDCLRVFDSSREPVSLERVCREKPYTPENIDQWIRDATGSLRAQYALPALEATRVEHYHAVASEPRSPDANARWDQVRDLLAAQINRQAVAGAARSHHDLSHRDQGGSSASPSINPVPAVIQGPQGSHAPANRSGGLR